MTLGRYLLPQYGTSLDALLREKIASVPALVKTWSDRVVENDNTLAALVCRHYLLEYVLDQPFEYDTNLPHLYILLRSFLGKQKRFTSLEKISVWTNLGPTTPADQAAQALRHIRRQLANRSDVTPYRLDRDHGLLSSLSMLYLLFLLIIILSFEDSIHPSTGMKSVLQSLARTLADVKGVLLDEQNQWFGPSI